MTFPKKSDWEYASVKACKEAKGNIGIKHTEVSKLVIYEDKTKSQFVKENAC